MIFVIDRVETLWEEEKFSPFPSMFPPKSFLKSGLFGKELIIILYNKRLNLYHMPSSSELRTLCIITISYQSLLTIILPFCRRASIIGILIFTLKVSIATIESHWHNDTHNFCHQGCVHPGISVHPSARWSFGLFIQAYSSRSSPPPKFPYIGFLEICHTSAFNTLTCIAILVCKCFQFGPV